MVSGAIPAPTFGFGLPALFVLKTQCHLKIFVSAHLLDPGGGHYFCVCYLQPMEHFSYAFSMPSNTLSDQQQLGGVSVIRPVEPLLWFYCSLCLCCGVACLVLSGIPCW